MRRQHSGSPAPSPSDTWLDHGYVSLEEERRAVTATLPRFSPNALRGGGRDEKHDDFSKLLHGAEHVAGLALDLPAAEPRHDGETARDQRRGDQTRRGTKANDERRDAEYNRRDSGRARRRTGLRAHAVGSRRR